MSEYDGCEFLSDECWDGHYGARVHSDVGAGVDYVGARAPDECADCVNVCAGEYDGTGNEKVCTQVGLLGV